MVIYARYPDQIISKFPNPSIMNTAGIVAVKLWSPNNKQWRLVILDDYLPYDSLGYLFGSSQGGAKNNKYWLPLLEKAVGKLFGSSSNVGYFVTQFILGPFWNSNTNIVVPLVDTGYSVFNQLVSYYQSGAVIVLSGRPCTQFSPVTCMVNNIMYGVIDLKVNVANSGFTFFKAQNSWSAGGG